MQLPRPLIARLLIDLIVGLGLVGPVAIVLWRCWRCAVESFFPRVGW